MDGQKHGQTDGQTDRQTNKWMYRQADEQTEKVG